MGLKDLDGVTIDDRTVPSNSELPFLSSETYLEDYEIIEMLCKPEYFRTAVMGLKGNIKEQWFIDYLKSEKYYIKEPNEAYPKYDILLKNKKNKYLKTQIKGTSKNMCDVVKKKIGVEVMGTHGQFPKRGYKKSMIDYITIIISEEQLKNENIDFTGLHFIMIPVSDLPLHYKIGKGKKVNKSDWDKKEFSDVIYPNIKLYFKYDKSRKNIFFLPDLSSYRKSKKHETIPKESIFRKAGPYYLDEIPNEF